MQYETTNLSNGPELRSRPKYLITIDTEGDDQWERTKVITTRNSSHLARFQVLCESYGFKPTYLTNYEMALCPVFCDFARDALQRDKAEIGMHLHAWHNPPAAPITEDDYRHHPYLPEYPEAVMRQKIGVMTELLEETFEMKMVSHRAGRWGFDATYARILVEHGYLVDCSVTPCVSWRAYPGAPDGAGGPDFSEFPSRAYFLDLGDIRAEGDSTLLEVPMTIKRPWQRVGQWLHRAVKGTPRLIRGPVNRLYPPISWLRPNGRNLGSMLKLQNRCQHEGSAYAQFTLHSSEFMPGGSPNFRTQSSIERLYVHLEQLFAEASRDFDGATLKEFYSGFAATRLPAARDRGT